MTILEDQLNADVAYNSFSEQVRQKIIINGKNLEEWKEHFYVAIDIDNLTPRSCMTSSAEIARLYQEAMYYYRQASIELKLLESAGNTIYVTKYNDEMADAKTTGVKMAAATLDMLARQAQTEYTFQSVLAGIAKSFWKDILDSLDVCRKLIDNITFNNNIEAKLMITTEGGDK